MIIAMMNVGPIKICVTYILKNASTKYAQGMKKNYQCFLWKVNSINYFCPSYPLVNVIFLFSLQRDCKANVHRNIGFRMQGLSRCTE
jgi:hypothetical protein